MSETTNTPKTASKTTPEDIHLPPNSFWPIILAFGFTLLVGGLAISWPMSIVGVVLTFVAAFGWVVELVA